MAKINQQMTLQFNGREFDLGAVEAKFGERLKQIKAWKAARRVNHDLT